jgi:hypothetical protein
MSTRYLTSAFLAGAVLSASGHAVPAAEAPKLYVSRYVGIEEGVQIGIANLIGKNLHRSAVAFSCAQARRIGRGGLERQTGRFLTDALKSGYTEYLPGLRGQVADTARKAAEICKVEAP